MLVSCLKIPLMCTTILFFFSFTYKVSRNADTYELPSLACKNFYKMAKMNDQLMNISKMCPKSKVEADQDGNYKMITSPDKFQCYQKIWKRALTMDNMEYVSNFFFNAGVWPP